MKVILLQNIRGLGKKYDTKDVSDGYARNFLVPRGLAEAATGEALKRLAELRSVRNAARERLIAELKSEAENIKGEKIIFNMKTGAKGEIFGSVTARDIRDELEKLGVRHGVPVLSKPIKELGETKVEINFGEGIRTQILVVLSKE
ncbi:MAG TPA: 50S ribosomal protein L9 [Candidatus Paceibacterota bacterium]|nr:50S ribosomal protein L9 [Candidatus Paceibacterota bacterium]